MGEWPTGDIYCGDFLIHPHAVMFKPIADLTETEKADLDASVEDDKAFMERQLKAFAND